MELDGNRLSITYEEACRMQEGAGSLQLEEPEIFELTYDLSAHIERVAADRFILDPKTVIEVTPVSRRVFWAAKLALRAEAALDNVVSSLDAYRTKPGAFLPPAQQFPEPRTTLRLIKNKD